jgi:hypothetical protein
MTETPKYRLQVEFDFNAEMHPAEVERLMYDFFAAQIKQWGEFHTTAIMKDFECLRVEVIDN